MISRRHLLLAGAAGAATATGFPARAAATDPDFNFLVLGDWGNPAWEAKAKAVAREMALAANDRATRFVISTGDNFYEKGVKSVSDPLWQTAFEAVYDAQSLQCRWYSVLGNHDYLGRPDAEIAYSLRSGRWRMPARYYARQEQLPTGDAADFFFLDTNMLVATTGADELTDIEEQIDWLATLLDASQAKWKFVIGHHPVFSGGVHGNTKRLVADVKPLLERYGVTAYLNGHDHDLQHIENAGVHYLTSGAGANTRATKPISGTLFCASELGFVSMTIGSDGLDAAYIGADGGILHAFAIPA